MISSLTLKEVDELNRRVPYRLNNFVRYDHDLEKWKPGPAALQFDEDGMSVFVTSILADLGFTAKSLLRERKDAAVFAISVKSVRECGYSVELSPDPDVADIGQAHASILKDPVWNKSDAKRQRSRLSDQFNIVAGEIDMEAPSLRD